MDKTDAEVHKVFSMVFAKLTDEEKANYGDVVEVSGDPKREIRHGEGDLQPETDVMKERELHSQCSFNRLHKIYEFLTLEQKEAIRRAEFGTFLHCNVPYVSTSLIMWLVENIDPSRCMFTLNGKKYKLSESSFENVMGIKDRGESVEFQGDVGISDPKDAIIGDKLRISMANLEEKLEESQDADDLFIARFTLVAIGSVLCPPSWVKLLNPGKEELPLCPLEDAKKKKRLPINYLKKHSIILSKGKDELMILKEEFASLRSLVVGFPEHVGQRIEEAEKTRNALIVDVKRLVEFVISQGYVRTKEDDNVMNVDEGENIIETSVGRIRKSSGATSKAKGNNLKGQEWC
ncbi:hypothetical protein PanWU01x14_044270 [Parasponia andersonii]|uniref:Uncharacterized protein n=1 Tax=Parasponia andersonii TaxID=3476 RepID=A0A2P5DP65_PARAD|nr:hypothetical protein PanWU01x14_044270 [Parasponia andersonii]